MNHARSTTSLCLITLLAAAHVDVAAGARDAVERVRTHESLPVLSGQPLEPIGTVRADQPTPALRVDSQVAVGNKGEERLDVSVAAPCGQPNWVFDRAELRIERNRFGTAQFVSLPAAGCIDCPPIVVRWYHEPTGYLKFTVTVYRRLTLVDCPLGQQEIR